MPDQKTSQVTIDQEMAEVRKVAGLPDDTTIAYNDRGWDSRVYSFENGKYYFKFPRSDKIRQRYTYEIAALKKAGQLDTSVKLQNILWEHPENNYFGYEGVEGVPLATVVAGLDSEAQRHIGEQLGTFLKQFHQIDLDGARIKLIEDEIRQIQEWYAKSAQAIEQHFTVQEQKSLATLVDITWPDQLQELGSDPVLCHGDMHLENVMIDAEGRIGVIDFGDVGYCDRSKDFLELETHQTMFLSAIQAYGYDSAGFRKKLAVRQAMIQIINLGFYAGKNDKENVAHTIATIKRSLIVK